MSIPQDSPQLFEDWLDGDANWPLNDQLPLNDGGRQAEGEAPPAKIQCEQMATALIVHGLLTELGRRNAAQDDARIRSLMLAIAVEPKIESPATAHAHVSSSTEPSARNMIYIARPALIALILTTAACFIFYFNLYMFSPANAAVATLERIITATQTPLDRTYVLHVAEEYSKEKSVRNQSPEGWPKEREECINGAVLHIRGADMYVFIRQLNDGRQRITGCDGQQSWAFREDGPVHVSFDLNRFRGSIPGANQDFPFTNMRSNLTRLRTGYDIVLSEQRTVSATGQSLATLGFTRKSQEVRGPKNVEIVFDIHSGTIHKMLCDGLPRGKGGPKSVRFELSAPTKLGPQFFSHVAHHDVNRRVIAE